MQAYITARHELQTSWVRFLVSGRLTGSAESQCVLCPPARVAGGRAGKTIGNQAREDPPLQSGRAVIWLGLSLDGAHVGCRLCRAVLYILGSGPTIYRAVYGRAAAHACQFPLGLPYKI